MSPNPKALSSHHLPMEKSAEDQGTKRLRRTFNAENIQLALAEAQAKPSANDISGHRLVNLNLLFDIFPFGKPEMRGKSCWKSPSHHGWLVITYNQNRNTSNNDRYIKYSDWKLGDCVMWNAVSSKVIRLPSLLNLIHKTNAAIDVQSCALYFSSNSGYNSRVSFLIVSDDKTTEFIVSCCPGVDKQWSVVKLQSLRNSARKIFCCKRDELYVMCRDSGNVADERKDHSWFGRDFSVRSTTIRIANRKRGVQDMLLCDNAEETKAMVGEENDVMQDQEQMKSSTGLLGAGKSSVVCNEILVLLADYLNSEDYKNFRAVLRLAIPQVKVLPRLVFSHYQQCGVYNFVDPANCNGEKHLMNFSELLFDAKILFAKGSWLLMSKGGSNIFFFKPFTREIIQLPDLRHACTFWGISFSTSPTSLDCKVFAIAGWTKYEVEIWFIARGSDCWHHSVYENAKIPSDEEDMVLGSSLDDCLEFNPSRLSKPVFYNGSFYCLDGNGAVGVFNMANDLSWKVLAKPQMICNSACQSFLAECDGKLLAIVLSRKPKWVQIFRLDFSQLVWVEFKSLGNQALFICRTSSLFAIPPYRHMENKIYFPEGLEGIVVYGLETGIYSSLGRQDYGQDFHCMNDEVCCSWIEPDWLPASDQELDWLSI